MRKGSGLDLIRAEGRVGGLRGLDWLGSSAFLAIGGWILGFLIGTFFGQIRNPRRKRKRKRKRDFLKIGFPLFVCFMFWFLAFSSFGRREEEGVRLQASGIPHLPFKAVYTCHSTVADVLAPAPGRPGPRHTKAQHNFKWARQGLAWAVALARTFSQLGPPMLCRAGLYYYFFNFFCTFFGKCALN